MHEIINLGDYESKADVTRDVGPDWQYMGHPTPALGGLKGSALATPFALGEAATGTAELTPPDATARYRQWLWAQMRGHDPGVLGQGIGRVQYHRFAGGQPTGDFYFVVVAVSRGDRPQSRTPVRHDEDGPVVSLAEQGRRRRGIATSGRA